MRRLFDILLVEDDPVLGPLTAESLAVCGHQLTLSPTVQHAFEQLKAPHTFNVIILDIELGNDRGEHLIGLLNEASIDFPAVVLFSAQPASELSRCAKAISAKGVLQKPSTVEQLIETLERAVA